MARFLRDTDVSGKKVLVRLDLDLPEKDGSFDDTRLVDGIPTLEYLFSHGAVQVTIIAHRGRPEGKKDKNLSLSPIEALLRKHFSKEQNAHLKVLENLRFDPREEANDDSFAKELSSGFDLFVNDAFATSHRAHASIVGVAKYLPTVLGFQFAIELDALNKVVKKAKRPFVVIIGGAKLSSKLQFIERLQDKADVILVGGKMAAELKVHSVKYRKTIVAELDETGKDITDAAIEQLTRFVTMAKTIVWNGPMGLYEDRKHRKGTCAIAEAVSRSTGFTVVGGGDSEAAVELCGVSKKIGFISSGGGAMLEYVTSGQLAGLSAAEQSPGQ